MCMTGGRIALKVVPVPSCRPSPQHTHKTKTQDKAGRSVRVLVVDKDEAGESKSTARSSSVLLDVHQDQGMCEDKSVWACLPPHAHVLPLLFTAGLSTHLFLSSSLFLQARPSSLSLARSLSRRLSLSRARALSRSL
jgi:hypothetical protein